MLNSEIEKHKILIEKIAAFLSAWRFDYLSAENSHQLKLISAGGRGFIFNTEKHNRLRIYGLYPSIEQHGSVVSYVLDQGKYIPSISFDISRPPQKLAVDIERRFLVHYERLFSKCVKECAEIRTRRELIESKVSALCRVYPIRQYHHQNYNLDSPRLSLSQVKGVSGEIHLSGLGARLELNWLPVDVMIKLLALLNTELSSSE